MTEPPEFRAKTLSPVSPLPLHPPDPSNISVLRNQIDPIFNMTSTHAMGPPADLESIHTDPGLILQMAPTDESSPSNDSNFSDAYKEQTESAEGDKDVSVEQVVEDADSDDYAMTFDSDREEEQGAADSQVISQANAEQDSNSLPAPVPVFQLPSHHTPEAVAADTKPAQIKSPPTHPLAADSPAPYDIPPTQSRDEAIEPRTHTYEAIANGEVDIQALLDNITANAEKNEAASALSTPTSANPGNSSLQKGTSSLTAHASLPPRPQVPVPTYSYTDDAAKHRPGSSHYSKPSNTYRPPPGVNVPLVPHGAAPGTSSDARGVLYAPPAAYFRQPGGYSTDSPISPGDAPYNDGPHLTSQERPTQSTEYFDDSNDADVRWGPSIQKKYDSFLTEERNYVTEGLWDKFPNGSRLFIGNLPSEKVTKRDIFHVFHKYGRLAQVAIKSAYGFVQFHDSAACRDALINEEGSEIRGRKIHLEISKQQKNTSSSRQSQSNNPGTLRRSRSPDYARQNMLDRGGRHGHGRQGSAIRDEYGRVLRERDDYNLPERFPSPPRGSFRGRDSYGSSQRAGDSYHGREGWRSRSRSPYGQRENGYRARSPSPRKEVGDMADNQLQIPHRAPNNIPDVQFILMTQLDRNFVSWVEGELQARGLKTEVLFLHPSLPLDAIIRRQILEGVHAVSQLDIRSQNSSAIPLQVFNRQEGANNVRFDEYQDLEPRIAAELVLRARTQAAPAYSPPQQQYSSAQSYPPAPGPNLANIVDQMDNASLQKLLGSMAAPQQQNAPAVAANSAVDLAGLLQGLQPQQQLYQQPLLSNPYTQPNLTSQTPAPQQSAQQVQNIMAQLAKFRQ